MPTIISSNLKRFQRQKELSIPKLAEQSGVSIRTIERIRSGKHVPDTQTILKLEKALGQDEGALVRGAVKKSDKHLEERRKIQERKDFTKFEREMAKAPKEDKLMVDVFARKVLVGLQKELRMAQVCIILINITILIHVLFHLS